MVTGGLEFTLSTILLWYHVGYFARCLLFSYNQFDKQVEQKHLYYEVEKILLLTFVHSKVSLVKLPYCLRKNVKS